MPISDLGGISGAGGGGVSTSAGGVDAVDTLANLTALPREEGKIYYATDTDGLYSDDGAALNLVGGGGITLADVDTHLRIETKTLILAEITAKQITLANTPNTPTKTQLTVLGGLDAEYTTDYTVAGTTLDWNGLGLDGLLATGDKLLIVYRTI